MSRNTALGLTGTIIGAAALGILLPAFVDRVSGLRAAVVFPLLVVALAAALVLGRISLVYLLAFVWFVPIETADPDIVVARVAGFDSAVYGLPKKTFPVLTEIPLPDDKGGLLVSTTKLSQFITGRYAPSDAWPAIWKHIFA